MMPDKFLSTADAFPDLRPGAVLPIGLAFEPSGVRGDEGDLAIKIALAEVLRRLITSFQQVVAGNADYFSGAPALSRLLTFPPVLTLLQEALVSGETQMIALATDDAGGADSSSRARERTHQLLLANVDLLLAVWDGKSASRRGGIDALVQSAVARRLPVIVVPPDLASPPYLLLQNDDDLDASIAPDLARAPLPDNLVPFVRKLTLPAWGGARRCLQDLFAEPQRPTSLRIEYDLLLTAFRARSRSRVSPPRRTTPVITPSPVLSLPDHIPDKFFERAKRIDELAGHYAKLSRASSTSEFMVLIIVALLSSVLGLLVPSISGISIGVQVIVNGLILVDITVRRRHRWVERWLDYRALAERLRIVQMLHPLGQSDGQVGKRGGRFHSWTDWYGRRIQRLLMPPTAVIGEADLPAIAASLRAVLDDQLTYHRRAFAELRTLEHRLHITARLALLSTIVIGIAATAAGHLPFGGSHASWHGFVLLALAVLPAAVSAFNGIRADADLAQLVERSALTASRLMRLRRALDGAPLTQDRVINAALRLASLMDDELSEWRLMLNNRRLRRSS